MRVRSSFTWRPAAESMLASTSSDFFCSSSDGGAGEDEGEGEGENEGEGDGRLARARATGEKEGKERV